ncbi:MAG: DUF3990 domain-containing protein [Clostridiales bacterium]|nr:DUF3990 domain-containing protein [Clostridiales bacterium]MCD7827346.1 DUF3990 domain-containing protein [Clostridiales bacterium]
MVLYHGSNVIVKNPRIIRSKRLLDFGTGFYLTTDYEQAKKWSLRTADRRGFGIPSVSVFTVDEDELKKLNVLSFSEASTEWLDYISENRKTPFLKDAYDVVVGPVANDQAIRTINNFLNGYLTENMAIQLLLPQKLKDQYAFKTELSLNVLHFKEAVT